MRGAGCTWNDLVDRDIDARVERTRSRPIPSGQVSVQAAVVFLVVQALVGLLVLVQFNRFAIVVGVASLAVVAIYPFMKRVTYWPQIFLGLAFSWGALMGWAAARGAARAAGVAALCRLDRLGDPLRHDLRPSGPRGRRAGRVEIDRAAVRERTKPMLAAILGRGGGADRRSPDYCAGAGLVFALGLAAFAAHLAWQIARIEIADPDSCLRMFTRQPRRRPDPVCGADAGRRGQAGVLTACDDRNAQFRAMISCSPRCTAGSAAGRPGLRRIRIDGRRHLMAARRRRRGDGEPTRDAADAAERLAQRAVVLDHQQRHAEHAAPAFPLRHRVVAVGRDEQRHRQGRCRDAPA